METVWTTAIKTTAVIIMLYPRYTPLSLITIFTSRHVGQTKRQSWPLLFVETLLLFPFVNQSVDFFLAHRWMVGFWLGAATCFS